MNYSLIRTPLAALLPSRLRHQMLVLLVAVMLVAMCALYAVSSQRAADAAFQTSSQWAGALARTAAGAAAPLLVKADDSGSFLALLPTRVNETTGLRTLVTTSGDQLARAEVEVLRNPRVTARQHTD